MNETHPQSKLTPPAVRLFYCVKIWGNTERTITNMVFILREKRGKGDHKISRLQTSNRQKDKNSLTDLVELKTAKFMFKIKINQLPNR